MSHYAQQGRRVSLANLTRGGAGFWEGKRPEDPRSLTDVRREELECAAKVLGIACVFSLDYPDTGLDRIDPPPGWRRRLRSALPFSRPASAENEPAGGVRQRVLSELLGIIEQVRPEVIVTFGPEGLYGHPDHRATHRLVQAAWHIAAKREKAPRKLYHLVAPAHTVRALSLPRQQPITTRIHVGALQDRKRAAFACHVSQQHERLRLERFIEGQGDWELFSLAEGRQAVPKGTVEEDLFA